MNEETKRKLEDAYLIIESKYSNNGGNGEPSGSYRDYSDADPDFALGRTNFPHGHGYPGSKKTYDQVVNLIGINGTTPADEKNHSIKHVNQLINVIKKNIAWLAEWDNCKIDQYRNTDNIDEVIHAVTIYPIDHFLYWLNTPLEKVTAPTAPEWWKESYDRSHQIAKQYPDYQKRIDNVREFIGYIMGDAPNNPENPSVYPLFVSLYDITRLFGGHEEGGWWYNYYDHIESIRVKSYKEAEKVAKYLYNKIGSLQPDGQPSIVLEKTPKSLVSDQRPEYS